MDLDNFISDLSSESPAPGGGAASAVMGVLGTALTSMVCALTEGREKYAENEEFVKNKHAEILKLQEQLKALKEEDILAFNKISAAYKMPKTTDEEKSARSEAIQKALVPATLTPLKIMRLSAEGLDITQSLLGKTNAMAISDLGCAALGFRAALQGAYLNVCINLASSREDMKDVAAESKNLLDKYICISDEIYNASLMAI